MSVIELQTKIKAPRERVFDLSRSIDLHKISTAHTNEKAIEGVTSGLIGLNESVTWEAKHLGFTQHLTSKITAFESPNYFIDEMTDGAFKVMKHLHEFRSKENGTLMIDVFEFESPFGIIGKFVNWLFLERYLRKLLIQRNQFVKEFAESDQWKKV
jgi:ligand-binding SRPBCC domain-containing protein